VLGFTGHRVPDDVRRAQRRAVDLALAGRWRAAYAVLGPWFVPSHPRIASAALWLLGPHVGGRRKDLRPLRIDADADDVFDASAHIGEIRCPTLVGSGGRDTAYPPDLVRELVAGLPDARHVDYPEAGHGGPGKLFAEEACAFLAER
jgi:pimeloyl-ACP methyl ester carboxylesterase